MYILSQSYRNEIVLPHIPTSRGHLPLLILLYRAVVGLLERNEIVNDSRLSFYIFIARRRHGNSIGNMTTHNVALSILYFKAGTLHAKTPDCIKKPGIYGTIINPIELLDILIIKDGVNTDTVRFAAQFRWNQDELNKWLKEGGKIFLSDQIEPLIV